jgi:hypothetical protein
MAEPSATDPSAVWPDLGEYEQRPGNGSAGTAEAFGEPDMSVLQQHRRPPPEFPLDVLGDRWGCWTVDAAKAAACPPDYVGLPLIASASAIIGNASWPQATPTWAEPPHVWMVPIGDSGDGKSPGADPFTRYILPALEHRMIGEFPENHALWLTARDLDKAALKQWQVDVKKALKEKKTPPPRPKPTVSDVEPRMPCLYMSDVTIEEIASVLVTAAPKGLIIVRDELVGWLDGMNSYNPAGRAFWTEAYGGRPYRVGRRKHSGQPIRILHNVVAVLGGSQPECIATLLTGADDGLLARLQFGWPDPIPFQLGQEPPNLEWAVERFDPLRELGMRPGDPPTPVMMPLTNDARRLLERFGREMHECRAGTSGLLRSAFGKARGTALRLSDTLQWLWWCGQGGMELPPETISAQALTAAAMLVSDYFMPMAERVFGDAATAAVERRAMTLAKWILKERPSEIHVRRMQRETRLPDLHTAELIRSACDALVEANWLRPPPKTQFGQRRAAVIYAINPKVFEK